MVHDFYIRKSSVGLMTLYQIAFVMLFWAITVIFFYSMGVDSGYKEGRRSVTKFYTDREKVRS